MRQAHGAIPWRSARERASATRLERTVVRAASARGGPWTAAPTCELHAFRLAGTTGNQRRSDVPGSAEHESGPLSPRWAGTRGVERRTRSRGSDGTGARARRDPAAHRDAGGARATPPRGGDRSSQGVASEVEADGDGGCEVAHGWVLPDGSVSVRGPRSRPATPLGIGRNLKPWDAGALSAPVAYVQGSSTGSRALSSRPRTRSPPARRVWTNAAPTNHSGQPT